MVLPAAGFWTITATPTPTATPATAQAAVQANAASVGGGGPPGNPGNSGNICAQYGFDKTIRSTWDWASNAHIAIDTYVSPDTTGGSGIGTNGILVVDFIATGRWDGAPTLP